MSCPFFFYVFSELGTQENFKVGSLESIHNLFLRLHLSSKIAIDVVYTVPIIEIVCVES
jgi:hypothetical protein